MEATYLLFFYENNPSIQQHKIDKEIKIEQAGLPVIPITNGLSGENRAVWKAFIMKMHLLKIPL